MHISKSLLKFLSAGFVLIFNLNSTKRKKTEISDQNMERKWQILDVNLQIENGTVYLLCDVVDGGDCAEALEELLGAVELEDSLVSNGYIPGALK